MTPEMVAALRAPFPPESIGHKPTIWCPACRENKGASCDEHRRRKCRECGQNLTTAHNHLDFVGHAYVRERLLAVDPEWNWEPAAYNERGLPLVEDGCLWIKLTVGGITRLGVGDAPGQRSGRALKEMIGDALRNAGQSFGIALDMWKKEAASPEFVGDGEPTRVAQTPEERKKELRGQIATIGKQRGKTVEAIADDFAAWSQGTQITHASVAVLAEYKAYLQNSGGSS